MVMNFVDWWGLLKPKLGRGPEERSTLLPTDYSPGKPNCGFSKMGCQSALENLVTL